MTSSQDVPAASPDRAGGVVVGTDGVARCPWAASHPLNRDYHDTEWGLPVRGDQGLFERISLEAFQSGLSWLTILAKRPAFRKAFDDFVPERVAAYDEGDVERLMADSGIVRNRAKIDATIKNAQAILDLREQGGVDGLIWAYRVDDPPAPATAHDVPTTSPASKAMAKELKSRGFAFVGPTTAFALMEAIGVIDTHLAACHRRGCRDR